MQACGRDSHHLHSRQKAQPVNPRDIAALGSKNGASDRVGEPHQLLGLPSPLVVDHRREFSGMPSLNQRREVEPVLPNDRRGLLAALDDHVPRAHPAAQREQLAKAPIPDELEVLGRVGRAHHCVHVNAQSADEVEHGVTGDRAFAHPVEGPATMGEVVCNLSPDDRHVVHDDACSDHITMPPR